MNKGFGLVGILIAILIVLAVGTAGVYVVKNSDLSVKDTVNTTDWETYKNENYGFEFKYPATWEITVNDSEGPNHKVITRVVNPARAGKPDTDVPIEQFLVRSQNITCEGQSISLGDKVGTDNGWHKGFGLIYYHDLCFSTQDWPTTISLSAYDESSQAVMDKILSTFKFID